MSQSEQIALKEERNELNVALKEVEEGAGQGTAGSQVDTGRIKREISRIDSILEQSVAPSVRSSEKDRLEKEEAELERIIAEGMPTQYEMRQPSKNPGAVAKHIAWSNRNQQNITRYVQIQKLLRPGEFKSIENLRKEK